MVSALLLGLIVVATLTGFDVTGRTTADERARAHADALAQKAEDELRGEPVSVLELLESKPRIQKPPKENGTQYTVESTAFYKSDGTATASCSSTSPSTGFYETTTKVTWPTTLGISPHPVVETGIVSLPPGSALVVQITNASGEPVSGATVTATGPAPEKTQHTLETSSTGCAFFTLLPGSYTLNAKKLGNVDPNWYLEIEKDEAIRHSTYLVAETATKEPFQLASAATLNVSFKNSAGEAVEGDTFVAANNLMSNHYQTLGEVEKYSNSISSGPKAFPFTSGYAVYAGTCEEDNPEKVNPSNPPLEITSVTEGFEKSWTVVEPSINVKVMSGTKAGAATEGKAIEGAEVKLVDTGCGSTTRRQETKLGALSRPALPFGHYSFCVGYLKKYFATTLVNGEATGTTEASWGAPKPPEFKGSTGVIYLGTSPAGPVSEVHEGTCP